jgi:maleylpyruvate isomerase
VSGPTLPIKARVLTSEEAALRDRQGAGARYDATEAPHDALALARSGTAYFARRLAELGDDELNAPSLLPGWTRRHVIAHVGYNARALTHLTEWARSGIENPMYSEPGERLRQIERGVTLPARALRHRYDHSAVYLSVEWRDLTNEQWDFEIATAQGRRVPVRETAWMRAKEVWIHAVDLNSGGSFLDFPTAFAVAVIRDVQSAWLRRSEEANFTLQVTDRSQDDRIMIGHGGQVISGSASDLARWLTGRGARGLRSGSSELPEVPRWF